jgi:hypothetical protein
MARILLNPPVIPYAMSRGSPVQPIMELKVIAVSGRLYLDGCPLQGISIKNIPVSVRLPGARFTNAISCFKPGPVPRSKTWTF